MSGTALRRITSLVRRNRQETPYRAWEDDQVDHCQQPQHATANSSKSVVDFQVLTPSPTEGHGQEKVLKLPTTCPNPEQNLVECFYLGSTDMTGLEIKGRGCIDYPAGLIWEQSQQDTRIESQKGRIPGPPNTNMTALVLPAATPSNHAM